MASGRGSGVRQTKERDEEAIKLRQLVQTLRGDLNMLSNEARKKYPAVREVWIVKINDRDDTTRSDVSCMIICP